MYKRKKSIQNRRRKNSGENYRNREGEKGEVMNSYAINCQASIASYLSKGDDYTDNNTNKKIDKWNNQCRRTSSQHLIKSQILEAALALAFSSPYRQRGRLKVNDLFYFFWLVLFPFQLFPSEQQLFWFSSLAL